MNNEEAIGHQESNRTVSHFIGDQSPAEELQGFLNKAQLPVAFGIAGQVVDALNKRIGHSSLSMNHIAQDLHMSKRTLQRRLKEQGTSFMELRDKVRKHYAVDYLLVQKKGVDYIYTSLDFSDRASLTNAFKRWTGYCPRTFRRLYQDYI